MREASSGRWHRATGPCGWACGSTTAGARAFDERWGFRQVGSETFRLGSDDQRDLLMERGLEEKAAGKPPA